MATTPHLRVEICSRLAPARFLFLSENSTGWPCPEGGDLPRLRVQIPAALSHALLNSPQGGLSQVSYVWGKHVCRKHQLALLKLIKGCFQVSLRHFLNIHITESELFCFTFYVVRSTKAPCEELGILFHFNRVLSCQCEWNICSCKSSPWDQPSPHVSYPISCLSFCSVVLPLLILSPPLSSMMFISPSLCLLSGRVCRVSVCMCVILMWASSMDLIPEIFFSGSQESSQKKKHLVISVT